MSVINQMLRDLDKRQASPGAFSQPPVVTNTKRSGWWWGLLLLPALWFGYQQFGPEGFSAVQGKTTAAPEQPAVVAIPAAPPVVTVASQASPPAAASTAAVNAVSEKLTEAPVPQQAAAIPANTADAPETAPAPQALATEPQIPEAEPENTEAYALSAETTAFLNEEHSDTAPAPVETPQMTVTKTDPGKSAPQHLRALAMQAQSAGRFGEAEAAWLQLIGLQPQQPESYEALAQLYLQQSQQQRLAPLLQQARQQQVQSAALQWAQLQLLASGQQWQALLDALTPALTQQFPQQTLALEAHAAQQLGQTERALQAYRRWTGLTPQDSRAWLGLAVLLDQTDQWPQAQQAYQQALQLGGLTDASRQFIQQRLQHDTQS